MSAWSALMARKIAELKGKRVSVCERDKVNVDICNDQSFVASQPLRDCVRFISPATPNNNNYLESGLILSYEWCYIVEKKQEAYFSFMCLKYNIIYDIKWYKLPSGSLLAGFCVWLKSHFDLVQFSGIFPRWQYHGTIVLFQSLNICQNSTGTSKCGSIVSVYLPHFACQMPWCKWQCKNCQNALIFCFVICFCVAQWLH